MKPAQKKTDTHLSFKNNSNRISSLLIRRTGKKANSPFKTVLKKIHFFFVTKRFQCQRWIHEKGERRNFGRRHTQTCKQYARKYSSKTHRTSYSFACVEKYFAKSRTTQSTSSFNGYHWNTCTHLCKYLRTALHQWNIIQLYANKFFQPI